MLDLEWKPSSMVVGIALVGVAKTLVICLTYTYVTYILFIYYAKAMLPHIHINL